MTKSHQPSRRDWIRLRRPKSEPLLGVDDASESPTSSRSVLQPVEHPPNYDGMDLSQLPPMREALLAQSDIEALFSDISEQAEDVMLMQRTTAARSTTASHATSTQQLAVAKDALIARSISRLQIRYRWQDAQWIDTIERQDAGYRLVRIAHFGS